MFYTLSKIFEAIYCTFTKLFLKIKYGKRIALGKKTKFRKGFRVNIGKKGTLILGDNNFFNAFCSINCRGEIIIGSGNIFGEYVTLYDHNHIFNKDIFNQKEIKNGKIIIGNENWICTKVNICSNSKIGNRCVISACTNYSNKIEESYMLYRFECKDKIRVKVLK
ncbi:MAG: acyltransferase [Bacilli bacterium]